MNSRRQALLFGVSGQVVGLLTRLQVCNETGGTSGGGTSHAVNFDKSTAMEREQRAIDAMRARRQAELDQMVRFRHLLCIFVGDCDKISNSAANVCLLLWCALRERV